MLPAIVVTPPIRIQTGDFARVATVAPDPTIEALRKENAELRAQLARHWNNHACTVLTDGIRV